MSAAKISVILQENEPFLHPACGLLLLNLAEEHGLFKEGIEYIERKEERLFVIHRGLCMATWINSIWQMLPRSRAYY